MKKIMTVSLESTKRAKAYAIYDSERLFVMDCNPISGPPSEWKPALLNEIAEKVADGFVVLVEDRTGIFCDNGTQFSFEEVDDGRTMLHHAFDWWAALHGVGNLLLDEKVNRYNIRISGEGALVDCQQDEKGRIRYNVNWQSFHGGHKAVLMCVVAAMMEPLSERYLSEMFAADDAARAEDAQPYLRVFSSLQAHDEARFRALDKENV